MTTAALVVSDVDLFRLQRALRDRRGAIHPTAKKLLEAGLKNAEVLPTAYVPADVVVMHAGVVFQDEETRLYREVVLVYPAEADARRGFVSVMSPLGGALFGLRIGSTFTWPLPGGATARFRVVDVRAAR